MNLGFLFTNRCNIQCDHCSTSCGPNQNVRLTFSEIRTAMEQAVALDRSGPHCFCISGGEPFLYWNELLEMTSIGSALGASMTCVTNGYWASTYKRAHEKCAKLRDAGLRMLAVSTSEYHQRFIPLSKVQIAARAAVDVGLGLTLKYAYSKDGKDPAFMRREFRYELDRGAILEAFSVMPSTRSGVQISEECLVTSSELPEGACPAAVMTVREDGRVYTCCIPGAFIEPLYLGNLTRDSLQVMRDAFEGSDLHQLLYSKGPAFIANEAKKRNMDHKLRTSYTSICDLCTHLLSDPELVEFAGSLARQYQEVRLNALLTA